MTQDLRRGDAVKLRHTTMEGQKPYGTVMWIDPDGRFQVKFNAYRDSSSGKRVRGGKFTYSAYQRESFVLVGGAR